MTVLANGATVSKNLVWLLLMLVRVVAVEMLLTASARLLATAPLLSVVVMALLLVAAEVRMLLKVPESAKLTELPVEAAVLNLVAMAETTAPDAVASEPATKEAMTTTCAADFCADKAVVLVGSEANTEMGS